MREEDVTIQVSQTDQGNEPALPVVQGLARLHDWMLIADGQGRVRWLSDGLASMCGGGRRWLGEPWLGTFVESSESRELLADLARTGRSSNRAVVLHGSDGRKLCAQVSAARIEGPDDPDATVALFRMGGPEARELHQTLGYSSAVLDSAPEGVVVIDRSRFITYANPAMAAMTGYAVDELVDRPLVLFLSSQIDLERLSSSLANSPDRSHEIDIDVRRRDGSRLCATVNLKVLTLPDATQIGAVAYVRDTTEVKQVQEELERKNAELEHYVNAVSHDLRSPLAALLGFSRLLREDYGHDLADKGNHFLRRIEEAGRTMEGLIHDLLEVARIGQTQPSRGLVDTLDVLAQLQAELKPRLEAAGAKLRLPAAPPMVHCDRTHLYQLLSNLIGNALDHMGPTEAPTIEVRVAERGDQHVLEVSDNGRGVAAEDRERIFELFRSQGRRACGSRGTGIGLAVVKKLAETYGGRAWVDEAPGGGARFRVELPAG